MGQGGDRNDDNIHYPRKKNIAPGLSVGNNFDEGSLSGNRGCPPKGFKQIVSCSSLHPRRGLRILSVGDGAKAASLSV